MKRQDVFVGVVVIEGTNSEEESAQAFRHMGAKAEIVHLKQLLHQDTYKAEERSLSDYDVLFFAGGFSAGDYVRAGAIFAARFKAKLASELKEYVASGKAVLGVCNGFQVVTEMGLLPDLGAHRVAETPEAVLHLNDSDRYECRPTYLKHVSKGRSKLTASLKANEVLYVPSAHAEGKFLLAAAKPDKASRKLLEDDHAVFTFTDPDGSDGVPYPVNPSGTPLGICGVTNSEGNVLGLMPHPERSFWRWQHSDWTRDLAAGRARPDDPGDGRKVLASVLTYCEKKL